MYYFFSIIALIGLSQIIRYIYKRVTCRHRYYVDTTHIICEKCKKKRKLDLLF